MSRMIQAHLWISKYNIGIVALPGSEEVRVDLDRVSGP